MRVKELLIFPLLLTLSQVLGNEVKKLYTIGYYYSQYFSLEENLSPERVLRFSVRAPRDAHVLLAPTHDADEPVYEIVLGAQNNTVNHIRGRCPCQEEPSASVRTVNLLSAQEFRNFWIKIKSERLKTFIQVGLGDHDEPFHEWRDPRPLQPQFLSFRSATKAEWKYGFKDSRYETGVANDRRQSVVTSTGFGQYFSLSDLVSHSADGVTLYFTVRTERELQVLMSSKVSNLGDVYLIGLHEEGVYFRRRLLGENQAALHQPRFLSNQHLRFWIKITTDGSIMFGKGDIGDPLLQWRDPYPLSPQYLSFTLYQKSVDHYDPRVSADVQYGLGPDYTRSSQDCTARWKSSSGKLVPGAVRGGRYSDRELFVCRSNPNYDATPGNYVVDDNKRGGCYISRNLSVLVESDFEILTGCDLRWVSTSLGRVPEDAIVSESEGGTSKYYIARVKHEALVIIGKLKLEERVAYVPYNGQELPFTNYEILVQPTRAESGINTTKNPFLQIPRYRVDGIDNVP